MRWDVLLQNRELEPRMHDRVRERTPPRFNQRIDQAMMKRVWNYARKPREEISARIAALDREWDLERVLETGAGAAALAGVLLSGFKS